MSSTTVLVNALSSGVVYSPINDSVVSNEVNKESKTCPAGYHQLWRGPQTLQSRANDGLIAVLQHADDCITQNPFLLIGWTLSFYSSTSCRSTSSIESENQYDLKYATG